MHQQGSSQSDVTPEILHSVLLQLVSLAVHLLEDEEEKVRRALCSLCVLLVHLTTVSMGICIFACSSVFYQLGANGQGMSTAIHATLPATPVKARQKWHSVFRARHESDCMAALNPLLASKVFGSCSSTSDNTLHALSTSHDHS